MKNNNLKNIQKYLPAPMYNTHKVIQSIEKFILVNLRLGIPK